MRSQSESTNRYGNKINNPFCSNFIWYNIPDFTQGNAGLPPGKYFFLSVISNVKILKLFYILVQNKEEIRYRLFSIAKENAPELKTQSKSLNQKWNSIFSKKLLQKINQEESQAEDLEKEELKGNWNEVY